MSCNICEQITDVNQEGKNVKLTKRQNQTVVRKQVAYVLAMSDLSPIDCIPAVKDILAELEVIIKR